MDYEIEFKMIEIKDISKIQKRERVKDSALGTETTQISRYTNEFAVTVHEDLLDVPLGIKQPKMIFVNSMSDLFHEDVPDDIIIKIFETMNRAYWHTFQVLTKRPKRLQEMEKLGLLNWSPNIWMVG